MIQIYKNIEISISNPTNTQYYKHKDNLIYKKNVCRFNYSTPTIDITDIVVKLINYLIYLP